MRPWLLYLGDLRVPNYFFFLMLGFALAVGVLGREARRSGIGERRVLDLALLLVPAVLGGARLAHAVFERPDIYLADPALLFRFEGGFVFYGGLIAAWVVGAAWSRRAGISLWRLADIFSPATAFGLAYGRTGCLGAGCCFGRPADWPLGVEVPWSVRYYRRGMLPDDLLGLPVHPAPLYEALGCLLLFVLLSRLRARQAFHGQVALAFLGGYGALRIAVELFRADAERGVYLGGWLSTSQLLSLFALAMLPPLWRWRRAAEP